jgi:hypothetical protein
MMQTEFVFRLIILIVEAILVGLIIGINIKK